MTTAIEKKEPSKAATVRNYISSDRVKAEIARALPKHLTADVMTRVVCTAILKTPKLAECRVESLLQSVMLLSQFGMLPDGRSAHLIPYFNSKANCYDCQAIIDWKGKVARATQNGVENIAADVVCFNDKFTWKMTPDGLVFDHEIDFRNPVRGEMFAAYCVWKHGGKFSGVIMTKMEIDAIRKRSKSPDKGPWHTDYNEMSKKTLVHRASKLWPLDAEFKEALEAQESKEAVIEISPLPELPESAVPDDSNAELAPAAETLPKKFVPDLKEHPEDGKPNTAEETAKQFLARMMQENGIAFGDLVSFCVNTGINRDADSWTSLDEMKEQELLAITKPVTMAKFVKTYKK